MAADPGGGTRLGPGYSCQVCGAGGQLALKGLLQARRCACRCTTLLDGHDGCGQHLIAVRITSANRSFEDKNRYH